MKKKWLCYRQLEVKILLRFSILFEFPTTEGEAPNMAMMLEAVMEKCNAYFSSRKNELASRYAFRKCMQHAYISRIKIMVKECDYGEENEKQLRGQIVFGCHENWLRDQFFREAALTLQQTVQMCIAHQASQKQMLVFRAEKEESAVHKIKDTKTVNYNQEKSRYKPKTTPLKECKFCGRKHDWNKNKYHAYGKTCSKCGRQNHFAAQCLARNMNPRQQPKNVLAVQGEDDSECEYVIKIADITNDEAVMASMEVAGKIVQFQVHPGASVNILHREMLPNVPL